MNSIAMASLSLISLLGLGACQTTSNDRRPAAVKDRQSSIEIIQDHGNQTTTTTERSSNDSSSPTESPSSSNESTSIASNDDKAVNETTDSELESGTGVNNGTGPIGKGVYCKGKALTGESFTFSIQYTAVVTFIQGLLHQGETMVMMRCEKPNDTTKAHADQASLLWTCKEVRHDVYDIGNLYHASIQTQAGGKPAIGEITIEQGPDLSPKLYGSMTCPQ